MFNWLGRRPETADSRDLQEDPDQIPVRHPTRGVRASVRTPALI